MINSLKTLFIAFILFISINEAYSQFGYGLTFSNDLYNRYTNPTDGIAHNGNGTALLTFGLGPKIWIGGESFSFSAETQVNLSLVGLSMPDYKGLGSVSFPVIGKFNFAGLSGLNKEGRFGLSIGGGMQWNRTELLYLANDYQDRGVRREFYKTYIMHLGYGFGISGFTAELFGKYGFNPDLDGASNFHIGLQFGFNIPYLKRIDDPASAL